MYVLNDDDDDVKTQVATTCYDDDVNTQVLNDDGGGPATGSGPATGGGGAASAGGVIEELDDLTPPPREAMELFDFYRGRYSRRKKGGTMDARLYRLDEYDHLF